MKPIFHPLFWLPFVTLALAGCGKASSHVQSSDDKNIILGDLSPVVARFQTSKNLSACDQKYLSQMSEIAAAVDQHKSDIVAYTADQLKHSTSSIFKNVQVGPMRVRETISTEAPKTDWQFETMSWSSIIDDYTKIKANPSNKKWAYLSGEVRAILSDDQDRIENGYPYAIGYLDQPLIETLLSVTQTCEKDAQCILPSFNDAGNAWMAKQKDYVSILNQVKASASHSDASESLSKLEAFLKDDLTRFAFRINNQITRDGSTLHLPLYTKDLASVTDALSGYIEGMWKSPNLSLKIDWKMSSNPDIFTIFLYPDSGGRSYVVYGDKKVVLYNNVRSRSIAHEIGHVLGFKDHYFEVWDSSDCSYAEQFREDDIMSDSTFASVLSDEWAQLQTSYPIGTTATANTGSATITSAGILTPPPAPTN